MDDESSPTDTKAVFSPDPSSPVGIFDSGVGGLSVLTAVRELLPGEDLIYLADQAHVPYGPRSLEQVRAFSRGIVDYLLARDAKLIVVACNTASAAALNMLRETYPEVPFVGMEPAVKPAAEGTDSGVVGVLATPATFQGELYHRTVARFASGVTVLQDTLPGLVEQIERGDIHTSKTRQILEKALLPMLEKGVDRVVLGCTHYPFVIPIIQEIVGPEVEVIDPAPAVARQVHRLLRSRELVNRGAAADEVHYTTTGDPARFRELILNLTDRQAEVEALVWSDQELIPCRKRG